MIIKNYNLIIKNYKLKSCQILRQEFLENVRSVLLERRDMVLLYFQNCFP